MGTGFTVDPSVGDFSGRGGRVWYLSYGSGMDLDRLRCYLVGGRPEGAAREYPGCRDPSPPVRSAGIEVPGVLYFATESPVWTGGRAFYDPSGDGVLRGRAHLIRDSQFSDIVAQEMYREPGADLDLGPVLADGRYELGPGRYETLVCPGSLDGVPVLSFTAPWAYREVAVNRPAPAYLRRLAAGLLAAGPWDRREVARYLAQAPGVAGAWTPGAVAELTAGLR
jgi:hypothetical protein